AIGIPATLAGLIEAVHAGHMEREGVIKGIAYKVHGFGCRMELPESGTVDVDLSDRGLPFFDAWRVQRFMASLGIDSQPSSSDIDAACQELVMAGELREASPGEFSIPEVM